jgi:hypothetical protein
MMRLNAIAHVRAKTIASKISTNKRKPGQPRFSRAASIMAIRAKGSAKTVCAILTNAPQVRTLCQHWFSQFIGEKLDFETEDSIFNPNYQVFRK